MKKEEKIDILLELAKKTNEHLEELKNFKSFQCGFTEKQREEILEMLKNNLPIIEKEK